MGFFSDLKDDLSQAVNELMPEEGMEDGAVTGMQDTLLQNSEVRPEGPVSEVQPERSFNEVQPEEARVNAEAFDTELSQMLDKVVEEMDMPQESVYSASASAGEEKKADMPAQPSKHFVDEVSVLTESMIINGNIATEGGLDVRGSVVGNLEAMGKLNITGTIQGNSQAAEIYAEGAKITGEMKSESSIKVGQSTVIIGNIFANSAVIAGAVKGDIDVKGPVILDASAIVMGNIKSKSVQINNGAVIEGMCSQCYAEVNPTSFFEELKKMK